MGVNFAVAERVMPLASSSAPVTPKPNSLPQGRLGDRYVFYQTDQTDRPLKLIFGCAHSALECELALLI